MATQLYTYIAAIQSYIILSFINIMFLRRVDDARDFDDWFSSLVSVIDVVS